MKVRIGIGLGRRATESVELDEVGRSIVASGFDSLWLSEVLTGSGPDPLVGLAWAAARTEGLKIGTTMLLPGRNPVRLAKSLASLDRLSGGRLLVTFVPGLTENPERDAIGVEPALRGAAIDEMLPLLRALLSGEPVSCDGPLGHFADVVISPLPEQQPLEFWLGGMVKSSLIRCGRLGDGWLPSLCTIEAAVAGRKVIEEAAAEAGRVISDEHFGVSIAYAAEPDDAARAAAAGRRRLRAGAAPAPVGLDALRTTLEEFIEVGFSKFVVRPLVPPPSWPDALGALAASVGDLQS